jgi:hypothetical protein
MEYKLVINKWALVKKLPRRLFSRFIATLNHDSLGLIPSTMITHAYLFDKNRKYVWTFASYEENDELFSDRNVFPVGCIVKMEKINER